MSRARLTDRLLGRLRAALGEDAIPHGAEIRRTRAGAWQRADGAWSWYVWIPEELLTTETRCLGEVGSQYSVSWLLSVEDWEIVTNAWNQTSVSPAAHCLSPLRRVPRLREKPVAEEARAEIRTQMLRAALDAGRI